MFYFKTNTVYLKKNINVSLKTKIEVTTVIK